MSQLTDMLDALTDVAVPATAEAVRCFIVMTIEDREALSDWLQDRFRLRLEDEIGAYNASFSDIRTNYPEKE